ncbi:MAG: helix-turn-helix domain-containing protein, partial [Microlunatus sp.]|nr:helix-turn-helix domain-containing protein [Microlunatus sp.]
MNREWLTTGQVAQILDVSRQHVVDLCDRGDLPSTRGGSHRRIRRAHLAFGSEPDLTYEQAK